MGAASWGEFGVPRPELDTPSRQQAEMSAAAAEPLQCSPMDGSPPGSSVPGILQARILEWVDIYSSPVKTFLRQNGLK